MDKYQGYEHFMTSYEVDEKNKNIVVQYADKTENAIVYSNHNISVMDERLYRQHQEIMRKVIPGWKNQMKICEVVISFLMGFIGADFLLDRQTYVVSPVAFMVYLGCAWMKRHQKVSRFQLTDYCLQNADSIRLVKTNPDASLKLSKKGNKAFEMDCGFSLNHAHLYTNHDLKTLKKVKKQEALQVSSNE